jgi:hypothetical protein
MRRIEIYENKKWTIRDDYLNIASPGFDQTTWRSIDDNSNGFVVYIYRLGAQYHRYDGSAV